VFIRRLSAVRISGAHLLESGFGVRLPASESLFTFHPFHFPHFLCPLFVLPFSLPFALPFALTLSIGFRQPAGGSRLAAGDWWQV
jgi:hypothetical protein